VAALYKLDTEDPAACVQEVEYFLKEDLFNCSPNDYEVTFSALFFQTISAGGETKRINRIFNFGSLRLRSRI